MFSSSAVPNLTWDEEVFVFSRLLSGSISSLTDAKRTVGDAVEAVLALVPGTEGFSSQAPILFVRLVSNYIYD